MKQDILLVLPSQPSGALEMVLRALIIPKAAPKPIGLLRPLSLSWVCHLLPQPM